MLRVRTWFIYLGKLKGIAPNSTVGSFDTSHHVALGVRMSSRGTAFIGNFVKNLPSGWEVEMGTQHKLSTTKTADHVGGPVGTRIGFIQ